MKLIILAMCCILSGCSSYDGYIGDGDFGKIDAPVFGNDGYLITFPDLKLKSGKVEEYNISRIPKKGDYIVFLSLPLDKQHVHIGYDIMIYKNNALYKSLDSKDMKVTRELGPNFHGLYFSSPDQRDDGVITIENPEDDWRFVVSINYANAGVQERYGNVELRQGGGK